MDRETKAYGLFLECKTSTPLQVSYHHMRLGKTLPGRFLGQGDGNLPEENAHEFDHLEDAIATAERVLKINDQPHLERFNPDEDVYRIEVREMYYGNGQVKDGLSVVIIDYAWGTRATNGQVGKENLERHSKVRVRWKQTLRRLNYTNN